MIVSIANNYPAGSILRVRDRQRAFSSREFEGAPAPTNEHTFLVLDGQQRLTSLYQAFYGVGDHRYYLDIRMLIHGADFEDAINYLRHSKSAVTRRAAFELQAKQLLLPLSMLHKGSTGFSKWASQVARTRQGAERDQLEDQLDALQAQWINRIDQYVFPVVTLSADTEPAALCTIFETLNRTGVKLSVFELLTARFWSHDLKLRELWEQARSDHPLIALFDVDPYYVLMAIALASGKTPSCKRGDVLNLTAEQVTTWWQPVIDGLALSLTILHDDCWVLQPKWLPFNTMLSPMAAALARAGASKGVAVGAQREQIKRWFWCSAFSQAYEKSPNTQSGRDVGELIPGSAIQRRQRPRTCASSASTPTSCAMSHPASAPSTGPRSAWSLTAVIDRSTSTAAPCSTISCSPPAASMTTTSSPPTSLKTAASTPTSATAYSTVAYRQRHQPADQLQRPPPPRWPKCAMNPASQCRTCSEVT